MILFPSAAETLFFSTKKRLRLEVVQDGLLSSTAVVLEMANLVKFLGHDIMDAAITAAGVSLLPFARKSNEIKSRLSACVVLHRTSKGVGSDKELLASSRKSKGMAS